MKTKIEPGDDGKDQVEAFGALRRDIEIRLDRILSEVPGDTSPSTHIGVPTSPGAGPSTRPVLPARPMAPTQREGSMSTPAPPPYGSAVREWRSEEPEKKD